jgi:hypothetical protein
VLVETTVVPGFPAVVAEIAAIEPDVATVMAKVLPVVSDFHPIVTDVAIITIAALGLGSNALNEPRACVIGSAATSWILGIVNKPYL